MQDLNCALDAKFTVDFTRGSGPTAEGVAMTAIDGSPQLAGHYPVCDSDLFTLIQTWRSSASGILTQVPVNIARSVQTVPLMLNVFKLSSLSDLVSLEYKCTLLGTASYNASDLSYVFNATSVYTNITVTKGDWLGLSIAGADFAPYCHLEYDVGSEGDGKVLLQQGAGQNSWRGLQG